MGWENRKNIVVEMRGKRTNVFNSMRQAGIAFGLSVSGLYDRIIKGRIVDGVLFRFELEGEDLSGIPNTTPERRIPIRKYPKKEKVYKSDDTELDREKYNIVPYEVRDLRVCITKCTNREFPQPLVGSAECVRCPFFKGRNKKTHEVACSNSMRTIR